MCSPPGIFRGHNFAMVTPQTDPGFGSSNHRDLVSSDPSSRPSPSRPSHTQPTVRSAGELSRSKTPLPVVPFEAIHSLDFSSPKSVILHRTTSYPTFASSSHYRATNDYTVVFNFYTHLSKASAEPGGRGEPSWRPEMRPSRSFSPAHNNGWRVHSPIPEPVGRARRGLKSELLPR